MRIPLLRRVFYSYASVCVLIFGCANFRDRIKNRSANNDLPKGEVVERSFSFSGISRTYRLYIPSSYQNGHPLPLVLNFHGGGGNAEQHAKMTAFQSLAEKRGFVLIEPDGTKANHRPGIFFKTFVWNAGNCCARAVEDQVDDTGFVGSLLESLSPALIDKDRVFATGFSNGGMLSHRLGCQLSDRIKAIAPVSGTMADRNLDSQPPQQMYSCTGGKAIPVLMIHGEKDTCVPLNGGTGKCLVKEQVRTSLWSSLSFWSKKNGCREASDFFYKGLNPTKVIGKARFYVNPSCPEKAPVEFWLIKDGGHSWPGADVFPLAKLQHLLPGTDNPPTKDISASEAIWDFFSRI